MLLFDSTYDLLHSHRSSYCRRVSGSKRGPSFTTSSATSICRPSSRSNAICRNLVRLGVLAFRDLVLFRLFLPTRLDFASNRHHHHHRRRCNRSACDGGACRRRGRSARRNVNSHTANIIHARVETRIHATVMERCDDSLFLVLSSRKKLLQFLEESKYYHADALLSKFPLDGAERRRQLRLDFIVILTILRLARFCRRALFAR